MVLSAMINTVYYFIAVNKIKLKHIILILWLLNHLTNNLLDIFSELGAVTSASGRMVSNTHRTPILRIYTLQI